MPFSELLNRRTDLSDAKLCSANLTFAELKNAKLDGTHACAMHAVGNLRIFLTQS